MLFTKRDVSLKQITCFFFNILVLLVGISTLVWADFVPGEILVGFQQEIIELPEGKLDSSIMDVEIKSPAARQLCVAKNVVKIERVFKSRKPGDTTAIDRHGNVVYVGDLSLIYKLTFPETVGVMLMVEAFKTLPEVVFAEPNFVTKACAIYPNDEHFANGDQWHLHNYGQSGTADADVDAPEAWCITRGSSSVVIAIVDHGVDTDHEDLDGKISGGETGYYDSHGTVVAGVAAAETNNSQTGVAGLAWECKIMPKLINFF